MIRKMWRSVLLWLLQRITAVLLLVLLGLHLWASNFITSWASLFRAGVDLSLLTIALFHGLNGVRTIVLDFGIGQASCRFLSVGLVMLGVAAFLFGAFGLWPLLFASKEEKRMHTREVIIVGGGLVEVRAAIASSRIGGGEMFG